MQPLLWLEPSYRYHVRSMWTCFTYLGPYGVLACWLPAVLLPLPRLLLLSSFAMMELVTLLRLIEPIRLVAPSWDEKGGARGEK